MSDTNLLTNINDFENWTDEKWVADYLHIKPHTIRKSRSIGKCFIPFTKIGGSVRYNKLEVIKYAESRLRKCKNDI